MAYKDDKWKIKNLVKLILYTNPSNFVTIHPSILLSQSSILFLSFYIRWYRTFKGAAKSQGVHIFSVWIKEGELTYLALRLSIKLAVSILRRLKISLLRVVTASMLLKTIINMQDYNVKWFLFIFIE